MRTLIADFVVLGEPVAKQRARTTRNGRAYTPARTTEAEALVLRGFLQSRPVPRIKCDLDQYAVEITFLNGNRRRKDLDNQIKLVLDALNGWAFVDDSQVMEIFARKSFVTKSEARTVIQIWRISE
jgi:crossover junction endodeoxyribonuclease RusA